MPTKLSPASDLPVPPRAALVPLPRAMAHSDLLELILTAERQCALRSAPLAPVSTALIGQARHAYD